MSLTVLRAGLQSTLQAAPRTGLRHCGVPASGPADPLSMALANRLVGNGAHATGLEATLNGIDLRFEAAVAFALAGAATDATLNGAPIGQYRSLHASRGDELCIGPALQGARVYVAVAGGFVADYVLGSCSTYLPAVFGGFEGRMLAEGDSLPFAAAGLPAEQALPAECIPPVGASIALRATPGRDYALLDDAGREALFAAKFVVGNRASRMGLQLEGPPLSVRSSGQLPSRPVFPGCVQCPEDGRPFLLGVDAQTTGGYAQLAQVIRADRHLLGQLRPGARVQLLQRSPAQAIEELHEKIAYWQRCLPDAAAVI